MTKIHEDPRQQNRSNLAGPMYQNTCTNKSDDSFLHLEAGHDLVAPYDLLHRMTQSSATGMSGASIGYTKGFYSIITL